MFRPLLTGSFAGVLALALAYGGLSWWCASYTSFLFERMRLSNEVLIEHLRLKASADSLLRKAALGALGERGVRFDADAARTELRERFDALRGNIAAEVALLPDDAGERADLAQLAMLEVQAHGVVEQLEQAAMRSAASRGAKTRAILQVAMTDGFGDSFRTAVDAAVAEEREEAAEAQAIASREMELVRRLSRLSAVAAVLLAGGALALLLRRLQRPLDRLAAAARAVAAGDMSHRIAAASSHDEFGRVGVGFNAMLEEVARGRAPLKPAIALSVLTAGGHARA
ncbi:MAG TPA: HAMP domain-containing protein [Falsiroseomonas sp.]|jgi:methyl-accepting chemotaxis protein|nr:HAMP domain-containing protein [Falsiroseomonas sp.]